MQHIKKIQSSIWGHHRSEHSYHGELNYNTIAVSTHLSGVVVVVGTCHEARWTKSNSSVSFKKFNADKQSSGHPPRLDCQSRKSQITLGLRDISSSIVSRVSSPFFLHLSATPRPNASQNDINRTRRVSPDVEHGQNMSHEMIPLFRSVFFSFFSFSLFVSFVLFCSRRLQFKRSLAKDAGLCHLSFSDVIVFVFAPARWLQRAEYWPSGLSEI